MYTQTHVRASEPLQTCMLIFQLLVNDIGKSSGNPHNKRHTPSSSLSPLSLLLLLLLLLLRLLLLRLLLLVKQHVIAYLYTHLWAYVYIRVCAHVCLLKEQQQCSRLYNVCGYTCTVRSRLCSTSKHKYRAESSMTC